MMCSVLSVDNGALALVALMPCGDGVIEAKYRDSGTLQVCFNYTPQVYSAIRVGRFLAFDNDIINVLYYIHTVQYNDKTKELWVYGYEAKELLNKQAMLGVGTPPSGTMAADEAAEYALVNFVAFGWVDNITVFIPDNTIDTDGIEYLSVLDFVKGVCKSQKAGIRMSYNATTDKADIVLYNGNDKSDKWVFSRGLGYLREVTITDSDKSYANTVYAVGTDGVVEMAQESNLHGDVYSTVLDLRESYPRPDDMTVADYTQAVQTRARMSMISRSRTHKSEINDADSGGFGNGPEKYGLGDIVGYTEPYSSDEELRRVGAVQINIDKGLVTKHITLEGV